MSADHDVKNPARPELLVLDDRERRVEKASATERLRSRADVRFARRPLGEMTDAELSSVRVLLPIRERTTLDAATLDRLPALELVLQTGGHAYHVDVDAARERGILVALGRGGTAARAAVPELTFALMVGCLRQLPRAHRAMTAGEWPSLVGRSLEGRRLGVLGVGRHGARVADIARAFGMEVVAWQRDEPGSAREESGVVRCDLRTLLRTSDVVSIHLRLSEESRGLLGRRELAWCKPGAVLINTARGAIVDEEALVAALTDGPLVAAGLDVFTKEPLPAGDPLRRLENVVMTPHVGWTVEEVFAEFAEIAADQLEDYTDGALSPRTLADPLAAEVERPRCGAVTVGP